VALSDYSSAVTQSTVYEAFGQDVAQFGTSTNNRLRNTKERDASLGLDNDGFRYYDPATGRYINRDPIGYGDGLNVYHSVDNDPVNHADPLGLQKPSNQFAGGLQALWNVAVYGTLSDPMPSDDRAVTAAYDQGNWDRSHGVADAATRRATFGTIKDVGGVTFDQANRADADNTGGAIIDTTMILAGGAGTVQAARSAAQLTVAGGGAAVTTTATVVTTSGAVTVSSVATVATHAAVSGAAVSTGFNNGTNVSMKSDGSAGTAPEGRSEPKQLSRGKRAHKEEPVHEGETPEVPTPSGKRMDRYDPEKAHIREIKSDNPRALKAGEKQVEGYRKEMEAETGRPHTTEVTPYNPKKYE